MKTDRTTKLLLAIIAAGLLLNGLNPWLLAIPARAAVEIDSAVTQIQGDLSRIQRGTCSNSKICD